jgi:hypothetical protein
MTDATRTITITAAALVGLAAGAALAPIASNALSSILSDPLSMCTRPEVRQFMDADLVRRTDLAGGIYDRNHPITAGWDSVFARTDPVRPKVYHCVVVVHGYISADFQPRFATAEARDKIRGALTIDPDTWRVNLGESYIVTETNGEIGIRAGW